MATEQAKREALSDVSHDIWSHWTRWQFSVCTRNEDGSLTIPAALVERWTRQMDAPYAELSEREKDSDREQADKILAVFPAEPAPDTVQRRLDAAVAALNDIQQLWADSWEDTVRAMKQAAADALAQIEAQP